MFNMLVFLLIPQLSLAAFTYLGCYSKSAYGSSGSSYMYQSTGYCQTQCLNSAYAALINGDLCYCSDSPPSGDKVSDLFCNTACKGYPFVDCGGSNYYSVYTSDSVSSNSDDSSSVSESSSSTQSASATSSSSSSNTDANTDTDTATDDATISSSTSSSASSTTSSHISSSSLATPSTIETTSLSVDTSNGKTITSAVIVKTTQSFLNVYITTTASVAPTDAAMPLNKTKAKNENNLLSGGLIAGIVVGVVAAVLIFLGVCFFIIRQRKKTKDLEKNAVIAATVVANSHPGRGPERRRFSSLRNSLETNLDDGPVIGSTGDGNGSAGVSRNASSRIAEGLGLRMASPVTENTLEHGSNHGFAGTQIDEEDSVIEVANPDTTGLRVTNPDSDSDDELFNDRAREADDTDTDDVQLPEVNLVRRN